MIILLLGVSLSLQSVFPTFFSIVFNCCIHLFHGHLCMSIFLDCNLSSNAVMKPVQKLIELKTAVSGAPNGNFRKISVRKTI